MLSCSVSTIPQYDSYCRIASAILFNNCRYLLKKRDDDVTLSVFFVPFCPLFCPPHSVCDTINLYRGSCPGCHTAAAAVQGLGCGHALEVAGDVWAGRDQ